MAVGDAHVFPGFLSPVLTLLFFPKSPTTFLTCFCRGERRKYAGKKSRLNRGSNSQPPGHESDTLTTEPPGRGLDRRLRRHLSQDEMTRGIRMLHSGLSQRHVANVLGVSQSVVSRMWNRFITIGNVRHLHAGGRERSTNEVQDRFLVVQARRHRFDNATTLRRDFQNATGVRIIKYPNHQKSVA